MVRVALAHEAHAVARFMKRFEKETEFVKVDVEYTGNKYEDLVNKGIATLFILENENGEMVGGLGCIVGEDLHTPRKVAVETYWLVDRKYRNSLGGIKLFKYFESWAESRGYIPAMVHLTDSYPEKLERLYLKRGYKLVEKHYIKEG